MLCKYTLKLEKKATLRFSKKFCREVVDLQNAWRTVLKLLPNDFVLHRKVVKTQKKNRLRKLRRYGTSWFRVPVRFQETFSEKLERVEPEVWEMLKP